MRTEWLVSVVLTSFAGYIQLAAAEDDVSFYGCYSNAGSLTKMGTDEFQSSGLCRKTCVKGDGFSVQAMTNGTVCMCGNKLPWDGFKTSNSSCKQICGGFKDDSCGSRLGDYFSVYLTGLERDPAVDAKPTSSQSSSSELTSSTRPPLSSSYPPTSSSGNSATGSGTGTGSSSSSPKSDKGGIGTAGAAAAVVVGVLASLAIGAGAWVFLRKRRRQKVEEEYRQSAAAQEFTKKPSPDHRLEPVMLQKRDSVGSIADNQDYSRRILKVTNPDGSN